MPTLTRSAVSTASTLWTTASTAAFTSSPPLATGLFFLSFLCRFFFLLPFSFLFFFSLSPLLIIFISSLKALDIEFLKRLHERVNIIPVIAKADTLSEEEKAAFKKRILADLEFHKISVYRIESEADDDAESKKRDAELEAAMPFAVIGSDREYEVNGKKVRARKYPWGIIEGEPHFLASLLFLRKNLIVSFLFLLLVENEAHSDFIKLRNLLVKYDSHSSSSFRDLG